MKETKKIELSMLDDTDYEIIHLLKQNAKAKMQDIGERVHLTGQAVSNRISRMEKLGIIKGYSVILDSAFDKDKVIAFVTIHMKSIDHIGFQKWCIAQKEVVEAHRISGDGCYLLKIEALSGESLNRLLDQVLIYANYSVNISINQTK